MPAERERSRPRAMVAILAFAGILVSLMQTIVVPLISGLPQLLNTTPANASWVITATLLAAAVCTPVSGRLGDMYGKRRMLLVCVALLVAGSVVCALSSWWPAVVAGRALQGAATSVIPLGISILRDELPPERVAGAMALISATLGVGGSIGLPVSALVAQNFDWHYMFWGAAGLGVIVGVLLVLIVPESPVRSPGRFDIAGAVGLAVGLVCLLLALTKGSTWGWGTPTVILLGAVGVVVLVGWVWFETRIREPMVDIRVSASRPVLLTNLASVMTGFAMYANALILPQLLQAPAGTGYGLGQSMVQAGLCLAPAGLVMMAMSPVAARVSGRYGPRTTLIIGLCVIAAGYIGGVFLMFDVWPIVLISAVNGAGVGFAFSAMPALIMRAVPIHETAAANGLNALMRSAGTTIASAVVALVLTNLTLVVGGLVFPTHAAFQWAFAIGGSAALVAVVLAGFIPSRVRTDGSDRPKGPDEPDHQVEPPDPRVADEPAKSRLTGRFR